MSLIRKKDEIKNLISSIVNSDERLNELETLIENDSSSLKAISEEISQKRMSVLPDIESRITSLLKQLGIPNAKFRISLTQFTGIYSLGY